MNEMRFMSNMYHSKEAEQAVLGAVLLNPKCLPKVKKILSVESFYDTPNRHVYKAILNLSAHGEAADLITLTEELKITGLLEASGGCGYISNLTSIVPSSGNVEHYAGIVADFAGKQNLLNVLSRANDALKGPVLPKELLKELAALASDLSNGKTSRSGAVIQCLAGVEPVKLQWLWPGKIPAGKLTLLVGDPGLGKSVLSLDLAARVSTGAPWPHAAGGSHTGDVIILSAEDDPANTIVPRLMAVGADLSNIFILKGVKKGDNLQHFSLAEDLLALEGVMTPNTRLIIIDPISAYLGDGTDSHVNTSVRSVLAPLADLASRTGAAVLAISHLNKGQGAAIYRIQGSIAFTAAARAVWAVARDQADEPGLLRLMLPVKCNLAPDSKGLSYELEDAARNASVSWGEIVETDAAEALTYESAEELSALQEAQDFLQELLAEGPLKASKAFEAARAEGIAKRTLYRAKKDLGIVSKKQENSWAWLLPGTNIANSPQHCQDTTPDNLGYPGNLVQSSEAQESLFAEKEGGIDE